MEKNEILIGREVEKNEFLVEKQYISVGRKHARILRKPDGIYIEDLDSANGTFVNGKPVNQKKITHSDKITLGGVDYYELNLGKVLELLPLSDKDFQNQFRLLKQVYEDHQTESNRLQTKGQASMMLRMMPTMVLGSLTGIFTTVFPDIRISILVIGGILTVAVFLVALQLALISTKKNRENLVQLNEKFELSYVCPACGASFKGRSWEFLKKAGKCPACQRKFHED